MRAISIRQPWAWMILNAGKDVENREWPTRVRGRVLIHASKGMTLDEWSDAWWFADRAADWSEAEEQRPTFDSIERGGIVGSVEIVGCVTQSQSPWFVGTFGFVLRNPVILPFYPCRGSLGFFDVDAAAIGEGVQP